MDVQVERKSSVECKLSVTVPVQDVDQAFKRAYREVGKKARVPGFRPGKAPQGVLEMHYGAQVREDVQQDLVSVSLAKAVSENEVEMIAPPKIDAGDLAKGAEFSYVANVETRPEVVLNTYEGLEVDDIKITIEDSEVEAELTRMREQAAQLVPVTVRDVVEDGDLVVVDFIGTVGGAPIPGGKAEGAIIEMGGEEYVPGLAEGLMGAKVPSERTIPVDFPEDYGVESMRGKAASFAVQIKEIKVKELPAMDDEFAKDVGEEDLKALTAKITGTISERHEEEAKTEQREALLKALVEANTFEVPPSMIDEEVNRMIIDAANRIRAVMGPQFNLDDLDIDSLRVTNRERAEFNVRSGLLLLEVSKAAEIEVGDPEIDAEIDRQAEEAGPQAARVRAAFASSQDRSRLSYKLLEDKTIAYLLEKRVGGGVAKSAKKKTSAKTSTKKKTTKKADAATGDSKPAKKSTAKKSTAKKATSKKTTTKKTTTKKTTTKKKSTTKKASDEA